MKKAIILFLLFVSAFSYSQIFPDLDPVLLAGHKIKMREYSKEEITRLAEYGRDNFEMYFADPECRKPYKGSMSKTPIPELNGRVFMVEEVTKAQSPRDNYYTFKLSDNTETIYHRFYPSYERKFEPVDFVPQPEYWDRYIKRSAGDSDMLKAELFGVFQIYRFINTPTTRLKADEDINIILFISENGGQGNGIKLYFESGKELFFPKGFVGKSAGVNFMGSLSKLTPEQLKILSTETLTHVDFKDGKKPFSNGVKFKNVLARFLAYDIK